MCYVVASYHRWGNKAHAAGVMKIRLRVEECVIAVYKQR